MEEVFKILSCSGVMHNGIEYKLGIIDKLTLIRMIYEFDNRDEKAFYIPQQDIAEQVGLERRSILRAVNNLTAWGVLGASKAVIGNARHWIYESINPCTLVTKDGEYNLKERTKDSSEYKTEVANKIAKSQSYYVYLCKLDGKPVYVGKGKESRLDHCLSGASSNPALNRAVFEYSKDRFNVSKLIEGLNETQALEQEKAIIKSFIDIGIDLYNRQHNQGG